MWSGLLKGFFIKWTPARESAFKKLLKAFEIQFKPIDTFKLSKTKKSTNEHK